MEKKKSLISGYLTILFIGSIQWVSEPVQEGAELPHPLLQQARENILRGHRCRLMGYAAFCCDSLKTVITQLKLSI